MRSPQSYSQVNALECLKGRRGMILHCCFVLSLILMQGTSFGGIDFYVSTEGNDSWSGKLPAPNASRTDGPFLTLEKARNTVREVNAQPNKEPVRVLIRSGRYSLPAGFALAKQDSGTAESPVIYQADEGQTPILVGGRVISDWKPWKGRILQTDVKAQGFQGKEFSLLLLNGEKQHLARYPNFDAENPYGGGWAYAAGKRIPMYQNIPDEPKNQFQVEEKDLREWKHPEQVQVFVFARYNWWNNISPIKELNSSTRRIMLGKDCSYPIRPGDRYYFQNALEELDAPGEWYLDSEAGTLYFWPPSSLEGQTVTAPTTRTILSLDQVSHVEFRGITFECAEGTAVTVTNSQHCRIAGCEVRSVGDYSGSGISISGGKKNTVFGCDVHHVGSTGISLSGGNRVTLEPAEHVAENNYLHHFGESYKQGVGIGMHGVGLRAAHNLMHDGPRMGIMFSGNNLLLEYNEIRHVNLETEDTGAVYTGGRDWISSRGTIIRHNYFHDILGYGKDSSGNWVSPHFAWGVYLDDNTGGVDVIGNVIARCSRAGIHLHNGRDNLLENNILIENRLSQIEFSGWTEQSRMWKDHFPTMVKGYDSVKDSPAWAKMRNMKLAPQDAVLPDGSIMSGNIVRKNVVAWKNPKATLFQMRNVSYSHNKFDNNLYWHFGQDIDTGVRSYGETLTDNLAPNPDFENGADGKLPDQWKFQVRPKDAVASATLENPHSGKRCLQIKAALDETKERDNYPIIISEYLKLTPGKAYRLRAMFRSSEEQGTAQLMLQSYVPKAYFWASSPSGVTLKKDWQPAEFTFRIPGPGENGYHEQMKEFVVRFDFKEKTGTLFVDDVVLQEVSILSGWDSWKKLGNDKDSRIADPRFVDFDHGNFTLKPDSPAFQLGFQAIPFEKIGPYADPLRASWPIQEAPGAREKPLTNAASAKK